MAPKAAVSAPYALLIKKQWCQKIFRGSKTWEIRGDRCRRRGKIYVAQCGASQLVGELDAVGCLSVGVLRQGRLVLRRLWWTQQRHGRFDGLSVQHVF